jgi:dienelactone hydrolase
MIRRACLLLAAFAALLPCRLMAQNLPGTEPWDDRGEPSSAMVEGIARFLDRELQASVERRQAKWNRDTSSVEAYLKSIEPNRERFRKILGLVEPRVAPVVLQYVSGPDSPAKVAETDRFAVYAVKWGVYADVEAEGLLLEPKGEARANVVAMADCDVTPEQFVGLAPGVGADSRVARLLAENGCRVLVPTLLSRSSEFSGNPNVRMTNLTHREWIWRQAFEAGRHPIGYEVEGVRAAIDWFQRVGQPDLPIGVMGHGEGGLLALYSAACDPRIDAAWVAGYFGPRERVWQEPIYRDVFGLLDEFGDAEIAGLIAPRNLVVEACAGPEIAGPPPAVQGRSDAASGRLEGVSRTAAANELLRAAVLLRDLPHPGNGLASIGIGSGTGPLNEDDHALTAFLKQLNLKPTATADANPPADARRDFDPGPRQGRIVRAWQGHTQQLLRVSELRRYELWSKAAEAKTPEAWAGATKPLRDQFWDEVIGRFPPADEPLKARSVKLYDEPNFVGYGVEIPVWKDVVASGVLLLPKDLKEGERRPVVVCQHGLEGKPNEVVAPHIKSVYNSYGAQLADRGYIVFAPQNPYIGVDQFRQLQKRLHPLKRSLFAVIVRQHERILEWLKTRPNVDPERIAFYGLSYGGKTAMRVPALLTDYCLSICSADFNEWVVKCTNLDRKYSYMYTIEYDMYEWDLAGGFNYAEMAGLICPRPFQVERGHLDGVAPDEWIGYEFAKVRRTFDMLGLGDRCDITYFNAGHQIEGKGTFAFLAKHLDWPRGDQPPR